MKKLKFLIYILIFSSILITIYLVEQYRKTKEIIINKDNYIEDVSEHSYSDENIKDNVNSNILNEDKINNSLDKLIEYDVAVEDDTLTFIDESGNMIVYIFDNDYLENVLLIVSADSAKDALNIEQYYSEQIGNGIIERVISDKNIVSIRYDMKYFEEYKDYTKDEIQDLLFKNAEIIEE